MEKFSERKWNGNIYLGDIEVHVDAAKFIGNRGKLQEWYGDGSVGTEKSAELSSLFESRSLYRTKIGEIKISSHSKKGDKLTFLFTGKGNPKF